jgi:hypothetical protein
MEIAGAANCRVARGNMPNTVSNPRVKIASDPPPVWTIGFPAPSGIAAVGRTILLPDEPRKKFVLSSICLWINVVARAGSDASSNGFRFHASDPHAAQYVFQVAAAVI